MRQVQAYDDVSTVMDSDTLTTLRGLDQEWQALVTEVINPDGLVEGTVLYFPGVPFNLFKTIGNA